MLQSARHVKDYGLLLGVVLLLASACEAGAARALSWDIAQAKNRCEWGYGAYCRQWDSLERKHPSNI